MRLISLLVLLAATFADAQILNFCAYYTNAVFSDTSLSHQYDLISAVVGRAILGCNSVDPTKSAGGACTGKGSKPDTIVVGLLDAGSSNANFFDGTGPMTGSAAAITLSQAKNAAAGIAPGPNGATKFANLSSTKTAVNNPSADFLIGHLVEWFGRDLGCTLNTTVTAGASSEASGIATYGGIGDMTALHKDMKINATVWGGFVTSLVGALTSLGVDADNANATIPTVKNTIVPYATGFLRATTGLKIICNQPDCACANGNSGTACDVVPTLAPGATTPPPSGTTAPPSGTTAPPTKNNNTATAVSASPIIVGAAVALTMLF